MLSRSILVLATVLLLTIPAASQPTSAPADAVFIGLEKPHSVSPDGRPLSTFLAADLERQPELGRILLGTTVGAAAGAAVGLGLSYLIIQATGGPRDAEMFFPLRVAVVALPAVPVGMYLGARWGSGGEGNPWLTAGAAVVGTGAGIGAGVLLGDALARGDANGGSAEIIGAVVGTGIAIGLPALVEWMTTR